MNVRLSISEEITQSFACNEKINKNEMSRAGPLSRKSSMFGFDRKLDGPSLLSGFPLPQHFSVVSVLSGLIETLL